MHKPPRNGPRTVAIFMDGNRRWAKQRGLTTLEGHMAGKNVFLSFLDFYTDIRKSWGTENYIFYAFSTENWNRSAEEVAGIMGIFERAFIEFKELLPRLKEHDIRITFIGERDRLSPRVRSLMEEIESATEGGTSGTIVLAISYGGKADILQAVNRLLKEGAKEIQSEDIDRTLWTADLPTLDLVIRPGGERRLSNFLTWQSAYSELIFTDTLWPDFTKRELETIFEEYEQRERRHGR
jgi:undecaprenyl diphosphate synthase